MRDFINLWLVEDHIQSQGTVTCGIFKIYFYNNLFNPDVNSKIRNKKTKKRKNQNVTEQITCFRPKKN